MSTAYRCRTCDITGEQHFYKSARYQCKKCWNRRTHEANKKKFADYMEERGGAKCVRCGYDKCIDALDFHHRNPEEKDPNRSKNWSIKRLRKELDKCDIVCSNCHREIHAEMRNH